MKITSNYAMSCRKPNFQASLSPDLAERLLLEAKSKHKTEQLADKIIALSEWGSKDSIVDTRIDLDEMSISLALNNPKKSRLYGGNLNVNENKSLLSQFFSLKEKNILEAEQDIINEVDNNKKEAIAKIIDNRKYRERLTGEENPTLRQLDVAIDSLSEAELMDYRFGLSEFIAQQDKLPDFDIEI